MQIYGSAIAMNRVFLTCAIVGNFTTRDQNENLPITPEEIANDCLEAEAEGAAIVHIHVRDTETEQPSMEVGLYREVVERIREKSTDLIINLTTGNGGRYHPSDDDPAIAGPRTNLLRPELRVEHVLALKPDIATLDLNTMLFGGEAVINTVQSISTMANLMQKAGVRPEIELFDSGDIAILHHLIKQGVLPVDPLCSIVMGVNFGFRPSPETLLYARDQLPKDATWTGFATGKWAFPMVVQSAIAGGNVRIGMEDATFLNRGMKAPSNAAMVTKAVRMARDLGAEVLSAANTRELLNLPMK
ncbi:Uncharacterized conserved protein, DUF849 family [Shimia gijangensis]|uniref:Uncharacterized conserved protein, DUF849 family n=1 Tax=Shimia gijangensis TaxID=1470563 RepID=A0A1M6SV06_9RHOB|nr:3-keto-5-aminohexanoate cleavage protein [Shimia gijangensis]SHK48408.1 Uncharacterized conserved protein, DUF849 family [Shimia gijangensis]